jgi:hypothetical protein
VNRVRSALIALLFACRAATAADLLMPPPEKFTLPRYALAGVDKPIALGELADVSVAPAAPNATVPNLASTAVQWHVWEFDRAAGLMGEKKVREYEGGIFFGVGLQPRRLFVQAVLTHLYLVKSGEKVTEVATRTQLLSATLTVGDPQPDPGPGPTPPPAPLPDGKYGLAAFAYAEASRVAADARVPGARACAKAFRDTAAAAKAGTLKTPEAVLQKAKAATDWELDSARVSRAAWDGFGTALQEKLYGLYKDKKLAAVGDFALAMDETAAGLEAIR